MRRQSAAWPVTSTSLPELRVPKGVPYKPLWDRSRPRGYTSPPALSGPSGSVSGSREKNARAPSDLRSQRFDASALGRRSVGPDLDVHVKALEEYAEAGVDELFVQQIGGSHDDFFAATGAKCSASLARCWPAATLASLLLDAALGWWWADSVAALLIAGMLLLEGTRTVASARQLVR
jgi:hypothetical protein